MPTKAEIDDMLDGLRATALDHPWLRTVADLVEALGREVSSLDYHLDMARRRADDATDALHAESASHRLALHAESGKASNAKAERDQARDIVRCFVLGIPLLDQARHEVKEWDDKDGDES